MPGSMSRQPVPLPAAATEEFTPQQVERAIPRPSGPEPEWPVPGSGWPERAPSRSRYWQRFTGPRALQMYESERQPWITYQHQLVYGLGRLGAFGAFVGVETPVSI